MGVAVGRNQPEVFAFMGYTTDFKGSLAFDRPVAKEHADYIRAFNKSRRMKRDPHHAEKLPDPIRIAANLPIGIDGGYFVGSYDMNYGQSRTPDILDFNTPPGQLVYSIGDIGGFNSYWENKQKMIEAGECQPGLWCQWTVSEDNLRLEWDGGEKFYEYVAWLKFIIKNFTEKWGYTLNGVIKFKGEDPADKGKIQVFDNVVTLIKK